MGSPWAALAVFLAGRRRGDGRALEKRARLQYEGHASVILGQCDP